MPRFPRRVHGTHFEHALKMCRVVDTPFSTVSASILFELRAHAGEPVALAAFHQVCAPGGPGTAELFDQAVSLQKSDGSRCRSFHEVFVADRPLALALDQAAQRVQAALGGLYEGKREKSILLVLPR